MPPPAPGIVVYTYQPYPDGWTSTFTTGNAELDTLQDEHDLHVWADDAFDPQGRIVLSKTLITNVGVIHRVKSVFSVNEQSYTRPYLAHLAFKDGAFEQAVIRCYVDPDRMLVNLASMGTTTSGTNYVSLGESHDFEAYYQYDPAHTADSIVQIYINGELYIDDSWAPQSWEENTQLNLYVRHGQAAAFGPANTMYHFEDFIYTIENTPGGGRWTMMALL